jgi:predicted nuclease of predicted toxin-antitoxin system
MADELSLRFITDEDIPRSTARVLRDAGFDADDVRDVGLRGKSDQEVFEFAQVEKRLLITCDMGFSNILHFPPGENYGILVVRVPDSESIENSTTRFYVPCRKWAKISSTILLLSK